MPNLKNPKADLRRLYQRTVEISIIIVLTILIAAFKFAPQISDSDSILNEPQELITIEDIINTVQKPKLPDPPKVPEIITAFVDEVPEDILIDGIEDYKPSQLPPKPPKPKD